ncbi:Hypothetical predicted protein [Marmota monax]|uniref:VWFD domain-containing protein n=1 Tax=Marmota monax TaxID=9995 RepID=A0A5E4CN90_MARMO|nr:Hypothetical predicted protein [Marmota monax]
MGLRPEPVMVKAADRSGFSLVSIPFPAETQGHEELSLGNPEPTQDHHRTNSAMCPTKTLLDGARHKEFQRRQSVEHRIRCSHVVSVHVFTHIYTRLMQAETHRAGVLPGSRGVQSLPPVFVCLACGLSTYHLHAQHKLQLWAGPEASLRTAAEHPGAERPVAGGRTGASAQLQEQRGRQFSCSNTGAWSLWGGWHRVGRGRGVGTCRGGSITRLPAALNRAHNGRVCSTWGDFHYKTFDGDIFRFPGLCNYVFSAHCGAAYEDFNLQMRRSLAGSSSTISRIVLKTQGLVLELSHSSVLVNGQREELPYSRAGFLVEQSGDYVKVSVQLLLTFLWNGRDSALLELDSKYANQTCGLCGDFNGFPASNEFFVHSECCLETRNQGPVCPASQGPTVPGSPGRQIWAGAPAWREVGGSVSRLLSLQLYPHCAFSLVDTRLSPLQFGNLQKLDGPTETCQDPLPSLDNNCTYEVGPRRHPEIPEQEALTNITEDSSFGCGLEWEDICHCTLLGPAFAECNKLVDPDPYVTACVQDLCHCPICPCATIAEYSRQCAQAGGQPQNWRGPKLCPRTCPLNMQHQECGSPCTDTCSNPQRSQLCEDHCVAGCFCPPGRPVPFAPLLAPSGSLSPTSDPSIC